MNELEQLLRSELAEVGSRTAPPSVDAVALGRVGRAERRRRRTAVVAATAAVLAVVGVGVAVGTGGRDASPVGPADRYTGEQEGGPWDEVPVGQPSDLGDGGEGFAPLYAVGTTLASERVGEEWRVVVEREGRRTELARKVVLPTPDELVLSADGRVAAFLRRGPRELAIVVWDVVAGREVGSVPFRTGDALLAVLPDERVLWRRDGRALVWSPQQGTHAVTGAPAVLTSRVAGWPGGLSGPDSYGTIDATGRYAAVGPLPTGTNATRRWSPDGDGFAFQGGVVTLGGGVEQLPLPAPLWEQRVVGWESDVDLLVRGWPDLGSNDSILVRCDVLARDCERVPED